MENQIWEVLIQVVDGKVVKQTTKKEFLYLLSSK